MPAELDNTGDEIIAKFEYDYDTIYDFQSKVDFRNEILNGM